MVARLPFLLGVEDSGNILTAAILKVNAYPTIGIWAALNCNWLTRISGGMDGLVMILGIRGRVAVHLINEIPD